MKQKDCCFLMQCPIFKKNVFHSEKSGTTYRALYCTAGEGKFKKCKRYQVVKVTGKSIPENILPNSQLSIEEIIKISTTFYP